MPRAGLKYSVLLLAFRSDRLGSIREAQLQKKVRAPLYFGTDDSSPQMRRTKHKHDVLEDLKNR
jgi:hypothetical protein